MKIGTFLKTTAFSAMLSTSLHANNAPDGTLTAHKDFYSMPTINHQISKPNSYELKQAPLLNLAAVTTPGEDDYQQLPAFMKRTNPPGIKDLEHPVHSLKDLKVQKPYFLR